MPPAIRSRPFISPSVPNVVRTDVDAESPVTSDSGREDASQEAWQRLIDHKLIEWGRDPSQLDDDEAPAASRNTIHLAIRVADTLRRSGVSAPTRVVPDAHGGIVFERQEESVFESIRVSADGSAEYCAFENARLVERKPWVLELFEVE